MNRILIAAAALIAVLGTPGHGETTAFPAKVQLSFLQAAAGNVEVEPPWVDRPLDGHWRGSSYLIASRFTGLLPEQAKRLAGTSRTVTPTIQGEVSEVWFKLFPREKATLERGTTKKSAELAESTGSRVATRALSLPPHTGAWW